MDMKNAIHIIEAYKDRLTSSPSNQLDQDIAAFDKALLAMREYRPRGEWIDAEHSWNCSICHTNCDSYYDYCPHCGADLRGSDDD